MVEVHTGAKPGRPQLLLVFCGVLLVAMLGLAWMQAHHARALGPEQRVLGTPFHVRLPKDWVPAPDDPRCFVLPFESRARRGEIEIERRLTFEFVDLASFTSLDTLLRAMHLTTTTRSSLPRAARIGPYPAVEVRKIESQRISRRQTLRRERIVRFTCLPNGKLIKITYEPLVVARPADFEILNDVCDTLRLEGPEFDRPTEDILAATGMRFDVDDDWTITGSAIAEVPGFYIGGTENGVPAWSLSVFRTWLAAGRKPAGLLADLAAEQWLVLDAAPLIETSRRDDGARVAHVRHPRFGVTDERIVSAWVVSASDARAVIILTSAGPNEAAAADLAARELALTVEIEPLEEFGSINAAEQSGRDLMETLRRQGPTPRWGSARTDTQYAGRSPRNSSWLVRWRKARRRDPKQGYEGGATFWLGAPPDTSVRDLERWARRPADRTSSWVLLDRASIYEWTHRWLKDNPPLTVVERRRSKDGNIEREIEFEGRPAVRRAFRPGAGFVPPPAEEIITGWVARGQAETAIIEVSSLLGPSTYSVLMHALPPDGPYRRVLIQRDFWPLGAIQAWDDDRAETVYEVYPFARFERIADTR